MLGSHAAAPSPPTEAAASARLRAVPVWAWLGSIVVAAAGVRWGLALGRAVPSYIPDEFLYTSLARSIGQHGTSEVHGNHAAFPALLQPLLTAPLWLASSVGTGFALVKALNAVAMAGASVPLYLLARRLGLDRPAALAAALLGALSPNLDYVGLILSNPISYPLVLGAVLVGISVLERATPRGQLGFLALSGLATFASIQFIVLPVVLLGAAVVVERGNLRRVASELRLTIGLLLAGSLVLLVRPSMLGFYRHAPHLGAQLTPASWLHWVSLGGFLLAISAGACFVPGATAAIAHGLFRARERREIAFAALFTGLLFAFLTEAASIELAARTASRSATSSRSRRSCRSRSCSGCGSATRCGRSPSPLPQASWSCSRSSRSRPTPCGTGHRTRRSSKASPTSSAMRRPGRPGSSSRSARAGSRSSRCSPPCARHAPPSG